MLTNVLPIFWKLSTIDTIIDMMDEGLPVDVIHYISSYTYIRECSIRECPLLACFYAKIENTAFSKTRVAPSQSGGELGIFGKSWQRSPPRIRSEIIQGSFPGREILSACTLSFSA